MAVEGYVGWHGQGKTYCAMADALWAWHRHGHALWTNAIVAGQREAHEVVTGGPEDLAATPMIHFETWDELMALIELAVQPPGIRARLVIDEAGKFLSSRFYQRLDPRVLTVLQERRKIGRGLDVVWTAPSFGHVDNQLRDVTQLVYKATRFGGNEYSHDSGRPPTGFLLRAYRPDDVQAKRAKAIGRRLLPFTRAIGDAYGTGIVSMRVPMAARVMQRPEYRDGKQQGGAEDRPVEVTVNVARTRRGRR